MLVQKENHLLFPSRISCQPHIHLASFPFPEQAKYELQEEDISRMCDEEQEAYLKNRCDEMKNMVFEIGKWPMFKVNMIRTTEDHVHVLYAFDALIMDAFSVIMLARELRDTYDGNVCDEKLELSRTGEV